MNCDKWCPESNDTVDTVDCVPIPSNVPLGLFTEIQQEHSKGMSPGNKVKIKVSCDQRVRVTLLE